MAKAVVGSLGLAYNFRITSGIGDERGCVHEAGSADEIMQAAGQGSFSADMPTPRLRIVALVVASMLAFAANSLLARQALGGGSAGALDYTGLRLLSGAATLVVLLRLRGARGFAVSGTWSAAASLLGYGLMFSLAYRMLGAATGALILFASVQFGILGWAVLKGDRPSPLEWLGIAVALAAFVFLVAPGLAAPPALDAAMMASAGLCWAAYTLLGKGSASPLADTAGNFVRCAPVALPLLVVGLPDMSATGAVYAVASGAVASGLGYAAWYAVLPSFPRASAAYVQLTVPIIAAIGGIALLGEAPTGRLVIASIGILGGVALALMAAEARRLRKARRPG